MYVWSLKQFQQIKRSIFHRLLRYSSTQSTYFLIIQKIIIIAVTGTRNRIFQMPIGYFNHYTGTANFLCIRSIPLPQMNQLLTDLVEIKAPSIPLLAEIIEESSCKSCRKKTLDVISYAAVRN